MEERLVFEEDLKDVDEVLHHPIPVTRTGLTLVEEIAENTMAI